MSRLRPLHILHIVTAILWLYLFSYHVVTSFLICDTGRDSSLQGFGTSTRFASRENLPFYMRNDSEKEVESVLSWKSTSVRARDAEVIYTAPSFLDENAFVEVKKRINGWHTVGIVGGPTKSIFHGVYKKNETTGRIDPYALGPSEYIRTMASVALCLAATNENSSKNPIGFLHMGYGSGSLLRFLRCAIPESKHVAIELDPTIVQAAIELGLVDPTSSYEQLLVDDALKYTFKESNQYNGICIDVFDGANLMPTGFYAVPFLEKLRDNILRRDGCAFVIHNFHVGTERLEKQLEDAMESYREVFSHHLLYRVDSLNTNKHGGNTILIAIANKTSETSDCDWIGLATGAMKMWGINRFDLASRIEHTEPF